MTARAKPFLASIGGETLPPPPAPPRKPRKGKTTAEREGTAITAGHTIELLLPALVELNRVWALGTRKASACHEAHSTNDEERFHRVPLPWDDEVEAIRETSGAQVAEDAAHILHKKLERMKRQVESAPVTTMEGLRAKTLAAMYEGMPYMANQEGRFDFGEFDQPAEMLFRACVSVTGLSELVARLEARMDRDKGATS